MSDPVMTTTKTDAAPSPAPAPGFFSRVRTGLADAVAVVEDAIRPDVAIVEHDVATVVKDELPAMEAEIVQYGLKHAPEFAATITAALVTAVPNAAGFESTIQDVIATGLGDVLGKLAQQFPPKTAKGV